MTSLWGQIYILEMQMSIPIHKKIFQIREHLGLSRPEFCEISDISVNTLKSIEQKGVTPKADVLVKIGMCWPEYTEWLLIGETPLTDYAPDFDLKKKYRIIDSVDVRYMKQCIVKSNMISSIIFIQSDGDVSDLGALLIVDNKSTYQFSNSPNVIGAVWIQPGNMNFDSDHGGKNVLKVFRTFLKEIDEDLILKAGLFKLNKRIFDEVHMTHSISLTNLHKVNSKDFPYEQYSNWKRGKGY